jgi:hypothetical protein
MRLITTITELQGDIDLPINKKSLFLLQVMNNTSRPVQQAGFLCMMLVFTPFPNSLIL